jgi:hypothetical protein
MPAVIVAGRPRPGTWPGERERTCSPARRSLRERRRRGAGGGARGEAADDGPGKQGGAVARRPEFQLLFRRLLGRLSSLARFHDAGPLDVDFRGLIEAAAAVRLVRDDTRWTRWARYSGRQARRMEWDGLVGEAHYDGDLQIFWPYLAFGQWTHVGSNTTFGLGAYRVEGGPRSDAAGSAT